MIDRADLGTIVWMARSLTERLAIASHPAAPAAVEGDAGARRLRRYCKVAGRGSWEKFLRRLSWDGLDVDTLRRALDDPAPEGDVDLPPWSATLEGVVEATRAAGEAHAFDGGSQGYPFEHVWLPAVAFARERLLARLAGDPDGELAVAGESAMVDLARGLLAHLSEISAPTLQEEFNRHRPLGLRVLATLRPDQAGPFGRSYYDDFVRRLREDGLLSLFANYPVLARLVSTSIDDWVDTQVEFLRRLAADLPALRIDLVRPASLATAVTSFDVGVSDRHRGGRSVVVVHFAGGAKVVYKPRDLGIEVAFNRLLSWCNAELDDEFQLRTLKVLPREGYGWVEHVNHAPVDDASGVDRFYRRAGRLLCVLYVLGATDCHHGNLIAAADQPVLVDLEALVYHELSWLEVPSEEREVLSADLDQLWDSVLRTGMLPAWQFERDKRFAVDLSALGCLDEHSGRRLGQQWRFTNTDYMINVQTVQRIAPERNTVMLGGQAVSPDSHVDAIVEGFGEMYDLLAGRQALLLGPGGPLDAFGDQPVRFIFRDTATYGLLLEHSLDPRFLRNGLDRSIELEFLGRALLHSLDRPLEWPVVVAEIEALERLDIPHFETRTSSTALRLGPSRTIDALFERPSYERTRRRLAALQPADRDLQSQMIRGSFHAKLAHLGTDAASARPAASPGEAGSRERLDEADYVRHAGDIARELDQRAIELPHQGLSWMHLDYAVHTQRFAYQPVNASLYEGVCGIALFLAAHGLITGDARSRSLAVRSLQSFRQLLRAHRSGGRKGVPAALGLGAGIGLGSIIYTMATIGLLIGDDLLIEDAHEMSHLLTPDLVRDDDTLDALSGSAGAVIGLLKLYQVTGDPDVLTKAVWCGDHLLATRTTIADGVAAWESQSEPVPLGGMAHGPSGVGLALARLSHHVDDPAYLLAVAEGLAYERTLFDEQLNDWRDLRERHDGDRTPRSAPGWCSGSPGQGLGRLSIARTVPACVDGRDLDRALRPTLEGSLVALDNLCCGNFGRIDFMLVAASELHRPELADKAHELAWLAMRRARQAGGYEFIPSVPKSVFSPGFFRGSSGVGYELLRLAHPDALPSVLIWD